MKIGRFNLHRRAFFTLSELSPADQAAVRDRLDELAGLPPREWAASELKLPHEDRPIYLVRIDDSLRAFIAVSANGEPEILDIVRRETLETFAKARG
jgi:hypothetical protein